MKRGGGESPESPHFIHGKFQLEDYQITESWIPIYCDNTAAICLSKNPILHSRAKHIEIKHHFIRDYVQKGVLDIQFIDTDH